MTEYLPLLCFLGLVSLAAVTGAWFPTGPWYEALTKPWWTPPNWAFPVAWSILYLMIAVAGWKVWKADGIGLTLIVWGAGVAINAMWSWLMFGRHQIGLAFADLVLLWLSIVAFIWLAMGIDRTAAYLFMPYFVWVSYAGALNLDIWLANP